MAALGHMPALCSAVVISAEGISAVVSGSAIKLVRRKLSGSRRLSRATACSTEKNQSVQLKAVKRRLNTSILMENGGTVLLDTPLEILQYCEEK